MSFRLLVIGFFFAAGVIGSKTESAEAQTASSIGQVSSFEEALRLTFERNPRIAALEDHKQSLAAQKKQAGYLPNPEIELEAENFGGSLDGYNEAETTLAVSQLFELGGKRSARKGEIAGRETLFQAEAFTSSSQIAAELKMAFVTVQYNQALEALAEEGMRIAKRTEAAVRKRVEKGATLQAEHTKARMEVQLTELAIIRARQNLKAAKVQLAGFWAGDSENIGSLPEMTAPAANAVELEPFDVAQSPFAGISNAKVKAAELLLELQDSQAVPDLTLGGGVRRYQETSDHAFVASLSIPLPLFDRNQGEISSARYELAAEKKERIAAERQLDVIVKNQQSKLKALLAEIAVLRSGVLPAAKQSFQGFQQAFQQGRSSYLEFSDAQGAFLEAKQREQDLRFAALESQIELQKLRGSIIPQHMNKGEKADDQK